MSGQRHTPYVEKKKKHPYTFMVEKPTSGWWLGHPSENYEFVNWDDDSNPIFLGKQNSWQPNPPNQQPYQILLPEMAIDEKKNTKGS